MRRLGFILIIVAWCITDLPSYIGIEHIPCVMERASALWVFGIIVVVVLIVGGLWCGLKAKSKDMLVMAVVMGLLFAWHIAHPCGLTGM